MNERLPYEDQLNQQWDELPLPDENMAWEDMKRRLEEDDDDTLVPFWLRGCGLWGLLGIVLLGLGWWWLRPDKWWKTKHEVENVSSVDQREKQNDNSNDTSLINKKESKSVSTSKEDSLIISPGKRGTRRIKGSQKISVEKAS